MKYVGSRKFWIIFWYYSLSAAVRFFDDHLMGTASGERFVYELRWYGITIPWTNLGFGMLLRVKVPVEIPKLDGEES